MFNPGEETEAHEDSIIRGEKRVGGAGRVLAIQDMDWDDYPWCGMEWEEAESSDTMGGGGMSNTIYRGRGA